MKDLIRVRTTSGVSIPLRLSRYALPLQVRVGSQSAWGLYRLESSAGMEYLVDEAAPIIIDEQDLGCEPWTATPLGLSGISGVAHLVIQPVGGAEQERAPYSATIPTDTYAAGSTVGPWNVTGRDVATVLVFGGTALLPVDLSVETEVGGLIAPVATGQVSDTTVRFDVPLRRVTDRIQVTTGGNAGDLRFEVRSR